MSDQVNLRQELQQECDQKAKELQKAGFGYQEGVNLYLIAAIADLYTQIEELNEIIATHIPSSSSEGQGHNGLSLEG